MLAAWVHDLSPFVVRFSGDFGLRWYGLSYAVGFLVGWLLLRFLGKRGAVLIPPERAGDAILYAVVGVVVGGRLGYCLFYEPGLLVSFDRSPPWWGLLAINRGGMASHGGMIGVIIAAFFIARGFKDQHGERRGRAPVLHVLDALALITPPGLMLGRIANFVNGELLGRYYALPGADAPWWTVRFPQEVEVRPLDLPREVDAARMEGIAGLLKNIGLLPADGTGATGASFDHAYRVLVEQIQHGNHELAGKLAPYLSARYPSQLIQGFAEGVVLFAVLWAIARRPRTPGVIGCWFLIAYGVLRITTEFWRLPDAQLTVQRVLGLSRGQWLSVAMVVAGLVALAIIARRGGQKLGGWARPVGAGTASGR